MITTAEQYNANLHLIYNTNPPVYVELPTADNIYNIDINTREIDAPQFLSVEKDHASETIYFIVDRYADYMDLSSTSCIITYTNAANKSRQYIVPFYDIYSFGAEDKMIIPWCLSADVTEAAGTVTFALQFFKTKTEIDIKTNQSTVVLNYNLNTKPAQSEVLPSLSVSLLDKGYQLNATQYELLTNEINTIKNYFSKGPDGESMLITHWTILD